MKPLFSSLIALTLLAGLPVYGAPDGGAPLRLAQRNDEEQGRQRGPEGGENRGPQQGAPNRGPQGGPGRGPAERGGAPNAPQAAPNRGPERGNAERGQAQAPVPAAPQGQPNPGFAGGNRGPRGGAPGFAQGGQFYNGGGGRPAPVEHGPRQFNKQAFQRNIIAPERFRMGAFHAPRGWEYRRWTYGEYLPPIFFAPEYLITDFWLYNLDRPPFGTEWVRYGPDALLVDQSNGEILQVVYNLFY